MQELNAIILELKAKLDSSQYVFSSFDKLVNFILCQKNNLAKGWKPNYVNKKIVNSNIFIASVLPFCDFSWSGVTSVDLVPSQNVLAGNYRGCNFPANPQKVCDRLNSYAVTGHIDAAQYIKLDPFNVYVACEGKNRVDLYRKIDRPIKAILCKTDYPKPHELEFIRFIPFGGIGLRYIGSDPQVIRRIAEWKLVNTRKLGPVVVLGFEESAKILIAYGVKFGGHAFALRAKFLAARIRIFVSGNFYVS